MTTTAPRGLPQPAVALRAALRDAYGASGLRADLAAGIVTGVVALPLSMALAIASGVPPQAGLYTAIVAGALIAVLGGSRHNVSGPTAAFVVVLAPITAEHGLGGLLLATAMAGVLLVAMGALRLGRLVQFIPYPVTTGFTAGIGAVIAILQFDELLGVRSSGDAHALEALYSVIAVASDVRPVDLGLGLLTLALLLLWPKVERRVPAPFVALTVAAAVAWLLGRFAPEHAVATIGSRFQFETAAGLGHGIPRGLPSLAWPWTRGGAGGSELVLSLELVRSLLGPAAAIAMLGAIESLLCAVVSDGMTGNRHDPDAELLAQGAGNLVAPFFGGLAATAAIARTATCVRAGARSPLAAVFHSGFVLLAMLALAPLLAWLPMAGLAGLLMLVAFRMADLSHVARIVRISPRSDAAVLFTCFALTVAYDMVVAVGVGLALASLLFMRRMVQIAGVKLVGADHGQPGRELPEGVLWYDVNGPLFFGAAEKAVGTLFDRVHARTRAMVLDLEDVPVMDATGLVALESLLARLKRAGVPVLLAGVREQPRELLARAGIVAREGELWVLDDVDEAVERVRAIVGVVRRQTPSTT